MNFYYAIAAIALACAGVGSWVLKYKNKELRDWALRKQHQLKAQGIDMPPSMQRTLQTMQMHSSAEGLKVLPTLNRFGIPTKHQVVTTKSMGRKQTRIAAVKARNVTR